MNETETIAKRKRGRPVKAKPDNEKIEAAAKLGMTDVDIAEMLGVDKATLNNYKKRFPDFFDSLKRGKSFVDRKVEESLYARARGYSVPDVQVTSYQGIVTLTPVIKHYPPDVAAMIFWLKNRKSKVWRDRQDITTNGEAITGLRVEVIRK